MKVRALPLFFFVALPSTIAACSGGGGGASGPKGTHNHYVVDSVTLPTNAALADQFGLDLDADGAKDNHFASILTALVQAAGAGNLDFQAGMDASVLRGDTLLLADLQATSLTAATQVGFATYDGANPSPSPCILPTSLSTCGQHLQGTGSFSIAPGSTTTGVVAGSISAGAFTGGPGELRLQLDLLGTPLELALVHARATLTGISPTALTAGVLAGAIPDADVQTRILPTFQLAIATNVARDCTGVGAGCGCVSGSSGASLLTLFDANNDCNVSLSEVQTNAIISTLIAPDLDTDGDGVGDALSIGVGISAVAATYTQP